MMKENLSALLILFFGYYSSIFANLSYDSIYWAPPLDVQGTKLVNANGYVVQLKGFATMGAYPSVTKAQIIRFRNDWKITVLRLPLLTGDCNCPRAICWPIGAKTPNTAYINAADSVIKWCRDNHIYVLLDGWHEGGQGNTIGNFGTTLAAWSFMADRYKNQDHLLWELFNEPHNADWTTKWAAMAEQMIDTIRLRNPVSKVIVVGTDRWDQVADVKTRKIEREKVVYSWHPYSGVYGSDCATTWEKNFGYIVTTGVAPVMNTEWGFDGNNVGYGTALIKYMNEKCISWTGWNYSSDWGPTMLSSVNPEVRNSAGNFMYKACHDTVPVIIAVSAKQPSNKATPRKCLSTTNAAIQFSCTEASPIFLSLYASDGHRVGTTIERTAARGNHVVRLDEFSGNGNRLARAVYTVRLKIKEEEYCARWNTIR